MKRRIIRLDYMKIVGIFLRKVTENLLIVLGIYPVVILNHPYLPLAALKKVGCKRTFIEKATVAHVKRAELTRCLKTLAAGDTLIVWKLDRLGRSAADAVSGVAELKVIAFAALIMYL